MTDDAPDGVGGAESLCELRQGFVLCVGKGLEVGTFELDTNGKIITALSALPLRGAGMPSALEAGNELKQFPVTANQEMTRDLKNLDGFEVGVSSWI